MFNLSNQYLQKCMCCVLIDRDYLVIKFVYLILNESVSSKTTLNPNTLEM